VRRRHWGRKLVGSGAFIAMLVVTGSVLAMSGKDIGLPSKDIQQAAHMEQKPTTSKKKSKPSSASVKVASATGIRLASCKSTRAPHANLRNSSVPQLRKYAEYEQVCGSAIAERVSFFVPTPRNTTEAKEFGSEVAGRLHEFARQGMSPLVILEPTLSGGGIANFKEYRAGKYDAALDAYFAAIKANGVTDAMMGMWLVFPEGNIPVWNNVSPSDFAACVTKTVQFQKKHFPRSKATILLDSKTYPTGTSWSGGKYVSLLPYVQKIPRGLIDSFGLQGFPWAAPANTNWASSYNSKEYLRTDFAIEAARKLGIRSVWLNTGTFARAYAQNPQQTVKLSPKQRQIMLDGVIVQARKVVAAGMRLSVHVFAEDKSTTAEGIDWSYWKTGQAKTSSATAVFKTLVHDLQAIGAKFWLFDTDEK